ncbi:MAG: hypothetical protein QOE92_2166 [Chloroflexota bacterium]|nr:hypothetical protein [Chloroflexota bacterium]
MRILVLNWKDPDSADAGGAELYVRRLVEQWSAGRHEVTLMTPRLRGAESTPAAGVARVRRGSRLTVFQHARQLLRQEGRRFDRVLESVSTRPFFAHELVGDRAVALYHQVADDVWRHEYPMPVAWLGRHVVEPRWIRRMQRARVVAVSPSTATDLARHGVEAVAIVPPGNDPPVNLEPRAAPASPPRVAYVGRLVRTKRPGDAIEAFATIATALPGAAMDVVGAGYLDAELRAVAPAGVRFHGHVSEQTKEAILAAADLVLCPGTREGWGIVVMEAAAFGVPVIAYDIPGLRDAVVDGQTGVLTAPAPAAMAAAAIDLLADPPAWGALARGARQRALAHTWKRSADDLMTVLAGVQEAGAVTA